MGQLPKRPEVKRSKTGWQEISEEEQERLARDN